ncbi:MAG: methylmalonyl-CoA/ethylmalonyl-CoA epimerase [Bacteroidia bacterium]|jgi:methylmalonyl-CoA/ethylmalonyl-CoA epimerase
MKKHLSHKTRIDHVAIAVKDINKALNFYVGLLGFELCNRRKIEGEFSGMEAVELCAGGFNVVLVQGTDPNSQVSRYIEEYGPGVQHIAIEVNDIGAVSQRLKKAGVKFATEVIKGENLIQIFTQRDKNSGMMFEFINRSEGNEGFEENNIQSLFEQLEASDAY